MHLASILTALALPLMVSSRAIIFKDGGGHNGGDGDHHGACLRACRPQKPNCPENMDPVKLGNCWTCCLRQEPWGPGYTQAQGQTQAQRLFKVVDLDDLEDVDFDL